MEIRLKDDKNIFTEDFVVFYIERIKQKLPTMINKKKLYRWDDYLNQLDITNGRYTLTAYNILIAGVNNLVYKKINDEYIINVNNNAFIPYVEESVESLVKLITYGNFEIKGYDVFIKCFEYFLYNVYKYYNEYVMGEMLCQ